MRRADRVADRFVHRLGEAAELADVEIDPTHRVFLALLRDENDFRFDDACVTHHAAARLDNRFRQAVAEMPRESAEDRIAIGFDARDGLQIAGGETATDKIKAALAKAS